MAEWKTANLASLLPPGTETILDLVDGILSTMSTGLNVVSSILDAIKSLISLSFLPFFDFLGDMQTLVEEFKNSFLATGFYTCQMFDYPLRQLTNSVGTVNYGPDNTFDNLNTSGNEFATSFLYDLVQSFDDTKDLNKPDFNGNCAIVVLVSSASSPDLLGITPGEDNLGYVWKGSFSSICRAAKTARRLRVMAMLGKFKKAAKYSPIDKVKSRVEDIEHSFRLLEQSTDDDLDQLEAYLESNTTGIKYFEDKTYTEINWEIDVRPFTVALNSYSQPSQYPDWSRITLKDINPDLVDIVDSVFDPIIDLLQKGASLKTQLIDLIDAIKSKIDYFNELIDRITAIIDSIEALLNATGFSVLYVSSDKGISDLKTKLQNATSIPFTSKAFYSGFSLLVGPESKTVFDSLFSALGDD